MHIFVLYIIEKYPEMKKLFIIFLLPISMLSQNSEEAVKKLKSVKELFDLELISKKEYDSIANSLKDVIINSKLTKREKVKDGFFIGEKTLFPEKFSESKTDIIGYALTSGLVGGGTKSYLSGLSSEYRLNTNDKIILRINQNQDFSGNSYSNIAYQQFFSVAQSPKDFALVKLNVSKKKNSRWIKTGSMSLADGYSFTVNTKKHLEFDYIRKEAENEFELSFNLKDGQYAFIFIGTSAYSNNAVFAFEIDNSTSTK